MESLPFQPPKRRDTLRIVPLGGCGEFGANLTAYMYDGRLFVVDCGVRFPDAVKLGTDAVIPDVDPWFAQAGGVHAYVLTHGHEDHIGAIPHVLPKWPAPVYGTPWTMELVRLKLQKHGHDPNKFRLITVEAGDRVVQDDVEFRYVGVNHSIPHTCALYIKTPAARVFHTGDFKFDKTPIGEPPTDFLQLQAVAKEGVELILADSTNAPSEGDCPGEATVLKPLVQAMAACAGAIVVTTFASNLWRLMTVVEACKQVGRKLFITGNGIEQTLALGKNTGLYHLPDNVRVTEENLGNFPREKLCVLATGCQGEWRSALARIANREHKAFKLQPGDTVILSARIIPGNEKAILGMFNEFLKQGARIVTPREVPGIHVSGHAYQGDLDLLVRTLKPKFFLPMHGAYFQLMANRSVAQGRIGSEGAATIMQNGDVIEVTKDGVDKVGEIEVGLTYVDSDSSVILPADALRERLKVGELGCAVVTGAWRRSDESWVAPVQIDFVGLRLPTAVDAAKWTEQTRREVIAMVPQLLLQKQMSVPDLMEELRISVRRQLNQVLRKKPVVLVKLQIL